MSDFETPLFAYRLPYGPHCREDWETLDFMTQAGVNTVCFSPMNTTNSLGEPYADYPNIWKGLDTYDFSVLDNHINDILRHNPQAKLLPLVDLNSPLWLARQQSMDSFYEVSNCALNPAWKSAVTAYMTAFLNYAEAHYADHIIGYILACGRTQEWIEADNTKAGNFKGAYYPQWCQEHNLPVLPIPRSDEMRASSAALPWLFDPQKDACKIQWLRYINAMTTDLAIYFVSKARELVRPNVKLGMFYGHIHSLIPSGQMDCERLYQTARPDFLIGAACNSDPEMGSSSGFINVVETGLRCGLGYMHENDRLTTTSNRDVTPFIHLSKGIWVRPDITAADIAMVKREVGLCLVHRFSTWWFNIWGQSYKSPEIRQVLKQSRVIWDEYMPKATSSNAQTVYVFDQNSNYYANTNNHDVRHLVWNFRQTLYLYGVNFTTATWDDLLQSGPKQFKFFIFQNPLALDDRKIAFLKEHVLKPGNAVLWCLPPALIHGGAVDTAFSEALSGNPVDDQLHVTTLPSGAVSASACRRDLLTKELIRDLAHRAGVHFHTEDADTVCWSSEHFLMAHRAVSGGVSFRLPQTAAVVKDLYADTVIAENTDAFTLCFNGPETKVLYFE